LVISCFAFVGSSLHPEGGHVLRRSRALLTGKPGSQGAKIRRALARLGCSVRTVELHQDLLRAVEASKPDMILLGAVSERDA